MIMDHKDYLYFLQPKGDDCDPYKQWLREYFIPNYGCVKCLHPRPEYTFSPLDVYLCDKPSKACLNVVFPPWISIARLEFLELFRDEVQKYLRLGKVYIGDDRLLEDFVTFTADRLLPIRGSRKSLYNGRCDNCGRIRYISEYPFYITRASLFDCPIFVPWGMCGLILTEELMSRVDKCKWKGISIFKLPVIDEPRDGVDDLPKDLIIAEDI